MPGEVRRTLRTNAFRCAAVEDLDGASKAWLDQHSPATTELDQRVLQRLFDALVAARPLNTGRTYWATISSLVDWGLVAGYLSSDPRRGLRAPARYAHTALPADACHDDARGSSHTLGLVDEVSADRRQYSSIACRTFWIVAATSLD
jgi:hypothetical protein